MNARSAESIASRLHLHRFIGVNVLKDAPCCALDPEKN